MVWVQTAITPELNSLTGTAKEKATNMQPTVTAEGERHPARHPAITHVLRPSIQKLPTMDIIGTKMPSHNERHVTQRRGRSMDGFKYLFKEREARALGDAELRNHRKESFLIEMLPPGKSC